MVTAVQKIILVMISNRLVIIDNSTSDTLWIRK
jgi:hypothetical protein